MRGEPHDFAGNEYHCSVCGSQYHCAKCNRGSSMLGHSMQDDAGLFFSCEEPERAEKLKQKWMESWKK